MAMEGCNIEDSTIRGKLRRILETISKTNAVLAGLVSVIGSDECMEKRGPDCAIEELECLTNDVSSGAALTATYVDALGHRL